MKNPKNRSAEKTILVFIAIFTIAFNAKGQSQPDSVAYRKNAIKINIIPPLVSSTSEISYERFLRPNLSLVAGIGANWRANQSSDFQLISDVDLSFFNSEVNNRYFLGEVRRYVDFCGCGPTRGFYAGGFVRYNSLDYSSDLRFENNSTNLETEINIDFQALNFGALLGYQVNLKNWIIDFEFGGLGYAPRWIQFNSSTTLSNDQLAQLSDALSQNFGIGGNYREIELNSSTQNVSFWYWTFRYAVSIGYNF